MTAQPHGIVELDRVAVRYGEQAVFANLSLRLEQGSFTILTGPSGAGKTSLLQLLYLAQPPSAGRVFVLGRDLAGVKRAERHKLRRRIGVVFQEHGLLDHLSAFDNVALPLRAAGQKPKDYAKDVLDLLTWVGLRDKVAALAPSLSGGERQRVAIARAIVGKPNLLIADEPTGNVDAEMSGRILRLFQELSRRGVTILIASHDVNFMRESGARIIRLADGALTEGPPARAMEKA
ncbi:MAG TPA: cell division ATP-binding protein FtsE [Hyphomonadaceae bacterium]|nr:cell division ATP-binding protein FtsE [Hyphomonadaceae bacterium]